MLHSHLDNSGHRTGVTEQNGAATRTVGYSYDNLYRLTSETIAGDANGNTTSSGGQGITYDFENRGVFSVDNMVNICYTPSVKVTNHRPAPPVQSPRQLDNPCRTVLPVTYSKQKIRLFPVRQFGSRVVAAALSERSEPTVSPGGRFLIDSPPIRNRANFFAHNETRISNRQSIRRELNATTAANTPMRAGKFDSVENGPRT